MQKWKVELLLLLQRLKKKLRAARQAEDPKAETEALAAISQLGYEQGKLAELKTQHQMQETAAKEKTVEQPNLYQQPRQQAETPPDPKAEAWAEENEWFGKDSAMTYTAFDLHRKLTEEEGIDPRSDEYYTEIDKRIRLEFPHKFDTSKNKPVSKPTQTVASATRSPKTNAKTVRLTSSQVAIAKKLGVPLERVCETTYEHEGGISIWKRKTKLVRARLAKAIQQKLKLELRKLK